MMRRRPSPFDLAELVYDVLARRRQPRSAALVVRSLDGIPRHARVLDLGAGTGRLAMDVESATGARVTACDVSLHALAAGRPALAGGVVAADGQALPFKAGSFAAVYLVYVLHHIPDHARLVAEARRVLERDGRIVLVEFDADSALVRLFRALARLRRRRCAFHTPRSLAGFLTATGFDARVTILDRATFVATGLRRAPGR